MKFILRKEKKLFSYKTLTRILIGLIFILSLLAGFYQSSLLLERKKYLRLEDKYVRVRNELGREETQRLINKSHQDSN